ncbi:MAG TPA: hypothetical protein VKB43_04090 [Gaiellaceae bacterium]|nr:hypothetical protein [Gaiellaceae bacterium]
MATDLNSPGFFTLVAQGAWPPGEEALDTFFNLRSEDVQAITKWSLRRSPRGRTWQGLFHLMEQKGYGQVRDMGQEAAVAWARHLGVTDQADADHYGETSVRA